MILPMPSEVIDQVHRLAEAAENFEGLFTDTKGNILSDQFADDDKLSLHSEEKNVLDNGSTGVDDHSVMQEEVNIAYDNQLLQETYQEDEETLAIAQQIRKQQHKGY